MFARALVAVLVVIAACDSSSDPPIVDAPPVDAPVIDVGFVDAPPGPTVEECDAHEPNDTVVTAAPFTAPEVRAAVCGNGDRDLFVIGLLAGQTISAQITFDNNFGSGDLDLRLLSGDGATVYDESRGSGDMEVVMCPGGTPCPALTAGTYVVEIFGFTPSVVAAYTLQITVGP
jgi:hypothetical protein